MLSVYDYYIGSRYEQYDSNTNQCSQKGIHLNGFSISIFVAQRMVGMMKKKLMKFLEGEALTVWLELSKRDTKIQKQNDSIYAMQFTSINGWLSLLPIVTWRISFRVCPRVKTSSQLQNARSQCNYKKVVIQKSVLWQCLQICW